MGEGGVDGEDDVEAVEQRGGIVEVVEGRLLDGDVGVAQPLRGRAGLERDPEQVRKVFEERQ